MSARVPAGAVVDADDADVTDPWTSLGVERTANTLSFISDVQSAVAQIEQRLATSHDSLPDPSAASHPPRASASTSTLAAVFASPSHSADGLASASTETLVTEKVRQFEREGPLALNMYDVETTAVPPPPAALHTFHAPADVDFPTPEQTAHDTTAITSLEHTIPTRTLEHSYAQPVNKSSPGHSSMAEEDWDSNSGVIAEMADVSDNPSELPAPSKPIAAVVQRFESPAALDVPVVERIGIDATPIAATVEKFEKPVAPIVEKSEALGLDSAPIAPVVQHFETPLRLEVQASEEEQTDVAPIAPVVERFEAPTEMDVPKTERPDSEVMSVARTVEQFEAPEEREELKQEQGEIHSQPIASAVQQFELPSHSDTTVAELTVMQTVSIAPTIEQFEEPQVADTPAREPAEVGSASVSQSVERLETMREVPTAIPEDVDLVSKTVVLTTEDCERSPQDLGVSDIEEVGPSPASVPQAAAISQKIEETPPSKESGADELLTTSIVEHSDLEEQLPQQTEVGFVQNAAQLEDVETSPKGGPLLRDTVERADYAVPLPVEERLDEEASEPATAPLSTLAPAPQTEGSPGATRAHPGSDSAPCVVDSDVDAVSKGDYRGSVQGEESAPVDAEVILDIEGASTADDDEQLAALLEPNSEGVGESVTGTNADHAGVPSDGTGTNKGTEHHGSTPQTSHLSATIDVEPSDGVVRGDGTPESALLGAGYTLAESAVEHVAAVVAPTVMPVETVELEAIVVAEDEERHRDFVDDSLKTDTRPDLPTAVIAPAEGGNAACQQSDESDVGTVQPASGKTRSEETKESINDDPADAYALGDEVIDTSQSGTFVAEPAGLVDRGILVELAAPDEDSTGADSPASDESAKSEQQQAYVVGETDAAVRDASNGHAKLTALGQTEVQTSRGTILSEHSSIDGDDVQVPDAGPVRIVTPTEIGKGENEDTQWGSATAVVVDISKDPNPGSELGNSKEHGSNEVAADNGLDTDAIRDPSDKVEGKKTSEEPNVRNELETPMQYLTSEVAADNGLDMNEIRDPRDPAQREKTTEEVVEQVAPPIVTVEKYLTDTGSNVEDTAISVQAGAPVEILQSPENSPMSNVLMQAPVEAGEQAKEAGTTAADANIVDTVGDVLSAQDGSVEPANSVTTPFPVAGLELSQESALPGQDIPADEDLTVLTPIDDEALEKAAELVAELETSLTAREGTVEEESLAITSETGMLKQVEGESLSLERGSAPDAHESGHDTETQHDTANGTSKNDVLSLPSSGPGNDSQAYGEGSELQQEMASDDYRQRESDETSNDPIKTQTVIISNSVAEETAAQEPPQDESLAPGTPELNGTGTYRVGAPTPAQEDSSEASPGVRDMVGFACAELRTPGQLGKGLESKESVDGSDLTLSTAVVSSQQMLASNEEQELASVCPAPLVVHSQGKDSQEHASKEHKDVDSSQPGISSAKQLLAEEQTAEKVEVIPSCGEEHVGDADFADQQSPAEIQKTQKTIVHSEHDFAADEVADQAAAVDAKESTDAASGSHESTDRVTPVVGDEMASMLAEKTTTEQAAKVTTISGADVAEQSGKVESPATSPNIRAAGPGSPMTPDLEAPRGKDFSPQSSSSSGAGHQAQSANKRLSRRLGLDGRSIAVAVSSTAPLNIDRRGPSPLTRRRTLAPEQLSGPKHRHESPSRGSLPRPSTQGTSSATRIGSASRPSREPGRASSVFPDRKPAVRTTFTRLPRVAELTGNEKTSPTRRLPRVATFSGSIPRTRSVHANVNAARRATGAVGSPMSPRGATPAAQRGSGDRSTSALGSGARNQSAQIRRTLSFTHGRRSTSASPSPSGAMRSAGSPSAQQLHEVPGSPAGQRLDRRASLSMSDVPRPRPQLLRIPRSKPTVPQPFDLSGLELHEKSKHQIEMARKRADAMEKRGRTFKARPMPDFSNPHPKPYV